MQTQPLPNLEGAPASVQAIVQQLAGHAPMTGKEIREATGLPRRTVYTALRRLREMGLLQERSSLKDTRQTYFWLDGGAPTWTMGSTMASSAETHAVAHHA